jgi:pantoate--beta-alanine ligase
MVEAFFMNIKIVGVATVREADGLAMSSRNALLTDEGRKQASVLHESLTANASATEARDALTSEGITVEYVEDVKDRRLGAVIIDNVRLIDNVPI